MIGREGRVRCGSHRCGAVHREVTVGRGVLIVGRGGRLTWRGGRRVRQPSSAVLSASDEEA